MMRVAKGTGLRQHAVHFRFASGCRPGARPDAKLAPRITEIRKLLRTTMSIQEIADALGCDPATLRKIIRRRQICNLLDRTRFITLQRSLARLDAEVGR
jgi:hypothetical protein